MSAVALSEKVPDPSLRPHGFMLTQGDLLDLDETARDLVAAGYEHVDQVEDRGQFAIRGGLLDVFPATEDRAVRVDLFGDEIESLRWFSTFTQRSLGDAELVEIEPAAELAEEHRELAEIAALENEDDRPDIAELLPVENFHPFLALAPQDATIVIAGEEDVAPALADHWQDVTAAFRDRDARHLYEDADAIDATLNQRATIRLSSIDQDQPFEFRAQSADLQARSLKEAEPELEKLHRSGYRTVVTFARKGEGERAAYNLGRLKVRWLEDADEAPGPDGRITFAHARLQQGFIAPQLHLAVIPEHRLFHRRRAPEQPERRRRRGVLRSFADLRTGDIVVHEDHGIARFAGFDTKTVANVTRDYLYLEYAGSDKVFVPVDQLAKISRYVGAGGTHPPLSKLGGSRWDTIKARARRAAQELAGELLNLYAERKRREGHSFPPDSDWQRDFEDAFPFTETPDQRDAIEMVKADMEAPRPMDRLICGDVGYGKTEVALRAAFKAVQDGKQVMLLVPTTILAQQHYGTFTERLKDFPITIEHASRFRPQAEQREAVKRFADGKVDILIGTHRLLSRDVRPKELGLLIVDEEQRFGVKQKELLRQLKLRVDVISMSATPIPRTLQMSMAGIRDISVIETPPEGRRPIKTYVGEYDEELVKTALLREHAAQRPGVLPPQPDRVDRRDGRAAARAVPGDEVRGRARADGRKGARAAHARLPQRRRRRARVDEHHRVGDRHPAGEHADRRAGRHVRARAAVPDPWTRRDGQESARTPISSIHPPPRSRRTRRRDCQPCSDYTELGAGFKIAMRDLEIRGAGNLLGDEQSGHVAALGFELYMQMLDEAVAAAADGAWAEDDWEPVRLDVNVDAYVPADYIPYEQAKVDVHRRIAGAREVADLMQLRDELEDRFGELPDPLKNLIALQQARIKLGQAGARAVTFRNGRLAVTPVELDSVRAKRLRQEIPEALYESGKSQLSVRVPEDPVKRFPAVVKAADVLLAVTREAA